MEVITYKEGLLAKITITGVAKKDTEFVNTRITQSHAGSHESVSAARACVRTYTHSPTKGHATLNKFQER